MLRALEYVDMTPSRFVQEQHHPHVLFLKLICPSGHVRKKISR